MHRISIFVLERNVKSFNSYLLFVINYYFTLKAFKIIYKNIKQTFNIELSSIFSN